MLSGTVDNAAADAGPPSWVFPVQLAWLVVLASLFAVDHLSGGFRDFLPDTLGHGIPFDVIWFGAVGGCLISLTGIVDHYSDWDARYNTWHPVRPLVSAITGGLGCLLLLVITELSDNGPVDPKPGFYAAVAFVFGYAEEAFRSLIKSLTDVVLGPGPTPASPGPPSGSAEPPLP